MKKVLIVLGVVAAWATVVIAAYGFIVYVVIHFIKKFW